MNDVTREQLHAYLDDALSDSEASAVEQALRHSEPLRQRLRQAIQERDRGEHSLGAIWRRERLSCPTREQLSGFLHQVLDRDLQAYVQFHLQTIACPSCQANLDDLREKQTESPALARRRRRYFEQSARLLNDARK